MESLWNQLIKKQEYEEFTGDLSLRYKYFSLQWCTKETARPEDFTDIFIDLPPASFGFGQCYHYYHWVTDFLFPFHRYWMDNLQTHQLYRITLKTKLRTRIYHFADFIEELYPNVIINELRIPDLSEIQVESRLPKNFIRGGLKGVFNETFAHLFTQKHFNDYYNWNRDHIRILVDSLCLLAADRINQKNILSSRSEIILIKRSVDKRYGAVVGRDRMLKIAGRQRRSIASFNAVETWLRKKFPDTLKVVEAEHLSFLEQIQCFRYAKVIIGEGGAGPINAMWAENLQKLIVIGHGGCLPPGPNGWFGGLAQLKNSEYFSIPNKYDSIIQFFDANLTNVRCGD